MNTVTTWSEVNQGDVVEGANSSLWSVVEINEKNEVTLLNVLTGLERTGQPAMDKEVVVVTKAAHALATAKALTTVVLGAQELGTRFDQNSLGEWLTPPVIGHAGALYTHLLIFHGVYGSSVAKLPLSGLETLHATIHDPSQRAGGYVPHVHDPAYTQRTA